MTDLKQVCYEHIKDSFYYGLFGDFKLVIDKNTGCFNATKLCDLTGKNFRNWARLQHSKALIEYYTKRCRSDLSGIFYEVKAAQYGLSKETTGQYICKELFLALAIWISVEFYDKCSKIVLDYLIKENPNIKTIEYSMLQLKIENEKQEEQLKQKQDKIDELIELVKSERKQADKERKQAEKERKQAEKERKQAEKERKQADKEREQAAERHNELLIEIEDLQVNVEDVHSRLDTATDDRVPKTTQNSIQERFILLKKNTPNGGYYTIRGQNVYVRRKLKVPYDA